MHNKNRKNADRYRLGFDIGGTFTDVVLVAERTGTVYFAKARSTPAAPELAAFEGIDKVLQSADARSTQVSYVVHGTTVSANAVLQHKGAKTGMLTTAGFRDLLEIGRLSRGHRDQRSEDVLYNIDYVKPRPIVPRRLRIEVPERIGARGEVITPLDEIAANRAIDLMKERGVESIAVCLLHSYANPVHELRLKALIGKRFPRCCISVSSEVLPQYREYERFSTTVLNAYVMPPLNSYLTRLERGLSSLGIKAPLHIMQATGGVMSSDLARVKSVHTALSGFVGGVLGGAFLARHAGFRNVITLDIGGTSTDISLVRDGEPEITNDGRLGEYPVQIPIVAVHTIGAGGGSIAHIGPDGLLKVGPISAGADPGPACYLKGGEQPTVTDANVCLGRLNPVGLLDGAIPLDTATARNAIETGFGKALGLNVRKASLGVVAIHNANIVAAIRADTVERGVDPRECVLAAFGGAGPLHAVAIARELGIPKVLVPPHPGVVSALGLLTSDVRLEYSRTWVSNVADVDSTVLERLFREMEASAVREMKAETPGKETVRFSRSLGMRYAGQGYEIMVPLHNGLATRSALASSAAAFHRRHASLYRHSSPDQPLEVVTVSLTAVIPVTKPRLNRGSARRDLSRPKAVGERAVMFDTGEAFTKCPIFRREHLLTGQRIAGPAIVEEMDSTTVIHPAFVATIDKANNLIISNKRRRTT